MKAHRHCLNCGHELHGKYCPQCGQAATTGRLSWGGLLYDFVHTLTHAEKSILGTTGLLIRHPAKVMKGYIAGKRKAYASPVSYFLVWVTLSILLHRGVIALHGFHPVFKEGVTFSDVESVKVFIVHSEWLYLICFPVSALLFWLILGRPSLSYIESLVVTIYAFATVNALHVLCYLIGGYLFGLNVLHWGFYLAQVILSVLYSLWVLIDLFRGGKQKFVFWRCLLYMAVNTVVVLKLLEWLAGLWGRMFHE